MNRQILQLQTLQELKSTKRPKLTVFFFNIQYTFSKPKPTEKTFRSHTEHAQEYSDKDIIEGH